MASERALREFSASGDIRGDASAIGCTPTASTMPASISNAANRRWAHRTTASPMSARSTNANPVAITRPLSMYCCDAEVVNA
jgi:hypothetical protein